MKEGEAYLKQRARELLAEGYHWDGVFEDVDGATRIHMLHVGGGKYQAVYLPYELQGGGRFKAILGQEKYPVLTMRDCGLDSYFLHHGIAHKVAGNHQQWPEYKMVSEFYHNKRANRTRLPYMNHIDEGLGVMYRRGASEKAMRAYCLHPLFQMDADLVQNQVLFLGCDPAILALAMEYRSVANEYLSTRLINDIFEIRLSPLTEVNEMLVADKVQNYKDFLRFHSGTHERSVQLNNYFRYWFNRLGVSYDREVGVLEMF